MVTILRRLSGSTRSSGGNAKKSDSEIQEEIRFQLGDGPLRFGPVRQMTCVAEEAERRGLSDEELMAFADLKVEWESTYASLAKQKKYTNEQMMQVAIYCKFKESKGIKMLKRSDPRYFDLSYSDEERLQKHLRSGLFIPCPGLYTKEGYRVVYTPAFRTDPSSFASASEFMDYYVYVLSQMTMQDSETGIALLSNLESFSKDNFSLKLTKASSHVGQGKVFPVKIQKVILTHAPGWFSGVWGLITAMVTERFASQIAFAKEEDFHLHFQEGFEEFLPDDFEAGQESLEEMVRDYVTFRESVDAITKPKSRKKKGGFFKQRRPSSVTSISDASSSLDGFDDDDISVESMN